MKPHKHAELIKAWADGAEIEFFDTRFAEHRWKLCGNPPLWDENYEYRIKPQPKPDQVVYPSSATSFEGNDKYNWYVKGNLKLVFDGETGRLKSAEVI